MPDWIVAEVTPDAVTMPSTVIGGREVPAANGVALLVQVITCPDGAAQVQPDPYAPTGVTPAGIVSLTDTGELSLAPEARHRRADRVRHRGAERGRRGAVSWSASPRAAGPG